MTAAAAAAAAAEAGFSGGIRLKAESTAVRAWPGGGGGHKLAGNYAPTIAPQRRAQAEGFNDVLWLFGGEEEEQLVTEVRRPRAPAPPSPFARTQSDALNGNVLCKVSVPLVAKLTAEVTMAGRAGALQAGSSNFFALIAPAAAAGGGAKPQLVTAPISRGDILPGVTRDSILALARTEE